MLHAFAQAIKLIKVRTMSTTTQNVIGICQMLSTNNKLYNRENISKLVQMAKGKSSFLFFPEGCDFIGNSVDETLKLAEPLSGETVNFYKELCKKNHMWVSCNLRNILM